MLFAIVKNTFYFYLIIHSILSLLSLMICLDNDIDHFEIQCPRMNNEMKEFIAGFFRPYFPETINFLVSTILSWDLRIINALIFSGILEVLLAGIGSFYYILVKSPSSIQKLMKVSLKLGFCIGIILWIAIYSSGIGIKKLLEILHVFYQNPSNIEKYSNDLGEFVQQRQQEIMDYYF